MCRLWKVCCDIGVIAHGYDILWTGYNEVQDGNTDQRVEMRGVVRMDNDDHGRWVWPVGGQVVPSETDVAWYMAWSKKHCHLLKIPVITSIMKQYYINTTTIISTSDINVISTMVLMFKRTIYIFTMMMFSWGQLTSSPFTLDMVWGWQLLVDNFTVQCPSQHVHRRLRKHFEDTHDCAPSVVIQDVSKRIIEIFLPLISWMWGCIYQCWLFFIL